MACNVVWSFLAICGGNRLSPLSWLSLLLTLALNSGPFAPLPLQKLPHYYGPVRHLRQPGLALTGVRLEPTQFHHLRLPVLRWFSMCTHAVTTTPTGSLDAVAHLVQRWQPSPLRRRVDSCIRTFEAYSAFTHVTACVLAESSKMTRSIEVLQRNSLPPSPAPTATGWSDQLPGGSCTHWRTTPWHGALRKVS